MGEEPEQAKRKSVDGTQPSALPSQKPLSNSNFETLAALTPSPEKGGRDTIKKGLSKDFVDGNNDETVLSTQFPTYTSPIVETPPQQQTPDVNIIREDTECITIASGTRDECDADRYGQFSPEHTIKSEIDMDEEQFARVTRRRIDVPLLEKKVSDASIANCVFPKATRKGSSESLFRSESPQPRTQVATLVGHPSTPPLITTDEENASSDYDSKKRNGCLAQTSEDDMEDDAVERLAEEGHRAALKSLTKKENKDVCVFSGKGMFNSAQKILPSAQQASTNRRNTVATANPPAAKSSFQTRLSSVTNTVANNARKLTNSIRDQVTRRRSSKEIREHKERLSNARVDAEVERIRTQTKDLLNEIEENAEAAISAIISKNEKHFSDERLEQRTGQQKDVFDFDDDCVDIEDDMAMEGRRIPRSRCPSRNSANYDDYERVLTEYEENMKKAKDLQQPRRKSAFDDSGFEEPHYEGTYAQTKLTSYPNNLRGNNDRFPSSNYNPRRSVSREGAKAATRKNNTKPFRFIDDYEEQEEEDEGGEEEVAEDVYEHNDGLEEYDTEYHEDADINSIREEDEEAEGEDEEGAGDYDDEDDEGRREAADEDEEEWDQEEEGRGGRGQRTKPPRSPRSIANAIRGNPSAPITDEEKDILTNHVRRRVGNDRPMDDQMNNVIDNSSELRQAQQAGLFREGITRNRLQQQLQYAKKQGKDSQTRTRQARQLRELEKDTMKTSIDEYCQAPRVLKRVNIDDVFPSNYAKSVDDMLVLGLQEAIVALTMNLSAINLYGYEGRNKTGKKIFLIIDGVQRLTALKRLKNDFNKDPEKNPYEQINVLVPSPDPRSQLKQRDIAIVSNAFKVQKVEDKVARQAYNLRLAATVAGVPIEYSVLKQLIQDKSLKFSQDVVRIAALPTEKFELIHDYTHNFKCDKKFDINKKSFFRAFIAAWGVNEEHAGSCLKRAVQKQIEAATAISEFNAIYNSIVSIMTGLQENPFPEKVARAVEGHINPAHMRVHMSKLVGEKRALQHTDAATVILRKLERRNYPIIPFKSVRVIEKEKDFRDFNVLAKNGTTCTLHIVNHETFACLLERFGQQLMRRSFPTFVLIANGIISKLNEKKIPAIEVIVKCAPFQEGDSDVFQDQVQCLLVGGQAGGCLTTFALEELLKSMKCMKTLSSTHLRLMMYNLTEEGLPLTCYQNNVVHLESRDVQCLAIVAGMCLNRITVSEAVDDDDIRELRSMQNIAAEQYPIEKGMKKREDQKKARQDVYEMIRRQRRSEEGEEGGDEDDEEEAQLDGVDEGAGYYDDGSAMEDERGWNGGGGNRRNSTQKIEVREKQRASNANVRVAGNATSRPFQPWQKAPPLRSPFPSAQPLPSVNRSEQQRRGPMPINVREKQRTSNAHDAHARAASFAISRPSLPSNRPLKRNTTKMTVSASNDDVSLHTLGYVNVKPFGQPYIDPHASYTHAENDGYLKPYSVLKPAPPPHRPASSSPAKGRSSTVHIHQEVDVIFRPPREVAPPPPRDSRHETDSTTFIAAPERITIQLARPTDLFGPGPGLGLGLGALGSGSGTIGIDDVVPLPCPGSLDSGVSEPPFPAPAPQPDPAPHKSISPEEVKEYLHKLRDYYSDLKDRDQLDSEGYILRENLLKPAAEQILKDLSGMESHKKRPAPAPPVNGGAPHSASGAPLGASPAPSEDAITPTAARPVPKPRTTKPSSGASASSSGAATPVGDAGGLPPAAPAAPAAAAAPAALPEAAVVQLNPATLKLAPAHSQLAKVLPSDDDDDEEMTRL